MLGERRASRGTPSPRPALLSPGGGQQVPLRSGAGQGGLSEQVVPVRAGGGGWVREPQTPAEQDRALAACQGPPSPRQRPSFPPCALLAGSDWSGCGVGTSEGWGPSVSPRL